MEQPPKKESSSFLGCLLSLIITGGFFAINYLLIPVAEFLGKTMMVGMVLIAVILGVYILYGNLKD